ncbi:MAG: twin-arginine translocase TatA/TatE family subunit [Putridiphycobacter sp.]|nr:twin-arginine translocase TatA/TatE family subunit [Putridiphycobacter sp.]
MTTTLLFLNDIGTGELLFVMMVVLMLFGAKNIPSIAKTLGRGMREIRQASDEIKRDIAKSATDMRRDMNMSDSLEELKKPFADIQKSIVEPSTKKKSTEEIEDPITTDQKKELE